MATWCWVLTYALLFYSISQKGPKADPNPWGSLTLEWTIPSPPEYHAFHGSPTVTKGPYDYESESD